MSFFNKSKYGIVKVARSVDKIPKLIARVALPLVKKVVPKVAEKVGNMVGLDDLARKGSELLLHTVNKAVNDTHNQNHDNQHHQ